MFFSTKTQGILLVTPEGQIKHKKHLKKEKYVARVLQLCVVSIFN